MPVHCGTLDLRCWIYTAGFTLFMKRFLIAIIRTYQRYISPMKRTKCPYYPTCSAYGLQAIERFGALRGGLLAAWRVLRCNPFSHGGVDLVPDSSPCDLSSPAAKMLPRHRKGL